MESIYPIPPSQTYNTLQAIKKRKAQLRKQIRKDSEEINRLRKNLFEKPVPLKGNYRLQSLMTTGAGVLDGALLIWKLYRKFKKKKR